MKKESITVIGIDPGFSGAIAFINDGAISSVDMPILKNEKRTELDEHEVRAYIKGYDISNMHIFIEKAQSMPGQGISSTGRYLTSYGIIRGICVGLGVPYTLVHPRTWKKIMMPDMPKEKEASIIRVKQMFPFLEFNRKKDHGQCDAILIAEYGRRTLV